MLLGVSFLMIVLAAEFGVFQRILDTVLLAGGQWIVRLAKAAGLLTIDEGLNWALRSRQHVR